MATATKKKSKPSSARKAQSSAGRAQAAQTKTSKAAAAKAKPASKASAKASSKRVAKATVAKPAPPTAAKPKAPSKAKPMPSPTKANGAIKQRGHSEPDRASPTMAEVDAEVLEFIAAIDDFKKANGRPFPSWSEVLLVVRQLGYKRA